MHLDHLRQKLKHVRRELHHVLLQHVLKRWEQMPLKRPDQRGIVRVAKQRRDGLEQVVREGGIARVFARLCRHRREPFQARLRRGFDADAEEADDAIHRAHRVFVLLRVGQREHPEQVTQHALHVRLHVRGLVPGRAARAERRSRGDGFADGEESLQAVCRVCVHHVGV